jgi:hypothetical protein
MMSIKGWLVASLLILLAAWMLIFLAVIARADDDESVIVFDDLYQGDLVSQAFEVTQNTSINIHAVGAGRRSADVLYAYGWILNNDTREPEWVMDYDNTDRGRGRRELREFDGEIELKTGSYTAYYYAGNPYSFGDITIVNLGDVFSAIGEAFSDDDYRDEIEEDLILEIKASDQDVKLMREPASADGRVVKRLAAYDDDYYESEGFSLSQPMKLHIYAIGEYSRGDKCFVDGAWIIDASTREKVWIMERWNTDPAGGASKNRMFNETESFEPGDYILYCSTDDSHSPREWNAAPPYDPDNWGVTIFAETPALAATVKPYEDNLDEREILSITRVGDGDFESRYMTIKEPTTLFIYAIGEYGYDDEFVDYGWIEEIGTMDRVWEMDWRNTEHAGGASKNRKFEGNVDFAPGEYAVYYVTDDSHSYRDWNATPPLDQRHYGITVYGAGPDFDKSVVEVSRNRPRDGNTLVEITAVGDDDERSEYFTLDKTSNVRIYAIGEGLDHEMYDYAWIEDANTGRLVWEMRYRKTRHAGGAKKNRMVDTIITLDRGEYEVFYITDGSHSFEGWNDDKPRDPVHWGVTVTLAD